MRFLRHLAILFVDCSPIFAPARLVTRPDLQGDTAAAGTGS
jgi:hypothetical protein